MTAGRRIERGPDPREGRPCASSRSPTPISRRASRAVDANWRATLAFLQTQTPDLGDPHRRPRAGRRRRGAGRGGTRPCPGRPGPPGRAGADPARQSRCRPFPRHGAARHGGAAGALDAPRRARPVLPRPGGWRALVGLDALLFGQAALVGAEDPAPPRPSNGCSGSRARGRNGRPVAIFSHKPIFVERADEGETGYWACARPSGRASWRSARPTTCASTPAAISNRPGSPARSPPHDLGALHRLCARRGRDARPERARARPRAARADAGRRGREPAPRRPRDRGTRTSPASAPKSTPPMRAASMPARSAKATSPGRTGMSAPFSIDSFAAAPFAIEGIAKSFNGQPILRDIGFTAEPGEFSSPWSARRAAASPRCCASPPASRRPMPAPSGSAAPMSRRRRPPSATSPWCSSPTRSIPISPPARTSPCR